MFRQIGWGAAAVLTAGILAVGCSDDSGGDTIISGDLTTDNYPGGTIQENNLADDKRAFSNQGQDLGNGEIFWNCETGQAIGAFTTEPDDGSQDDILYLAYFDSNRWHPPVEVRGINEDSDSSVNGVKALWLNTSGHADPEAAARNGDAIILFTRNDAAPTQVNATIDEESNRRLYAVYFDVSEIGAVGTPARRGGFDTVGSLIDFDNVIDTGGTGSQPDQDLSVSAFGFVSDSLCCTHEFDSGYDAVDSGEPTTFVHLVYRKDPAEGDPDTTDLGVRYWSVLFDIAQPGNAFTTGTSSAVIDLPAGLDTADTVEDVSSTFVVHNQHMFWTVSGIDDTNSTDQALIVSVFGTTAGSTEIEVGSAPLNDSSDTSNLPEPSNVYGEDHGLAETVFFFTETGFEDDSTDDADRSQDADLMVGQLRLDATTGATTLGTGSPREIDAHTDLLDLTSADADGIAVRNGDNGDVDVNSVQTRINRTASGIAVLWLQEFSDITDPDDSAATGDTETTLLVNNVPFTAVYQTRRDRTDARTLANAMTTAEPVGALTEANATADDATEEAEGNAFNVEFQGGLAQGQAVSQSGEPCDPACGFQGNHLRYSVIFQQAEDQTGTTGDEDNTILYVNSFVIDGGDTATTDPTITETGADEVEELDTFWGGIDAIAVDAGDDSTSGNPPVSTAGAGRVLIFFTSNDNEELDETVSGSYESRRLFVSEQDAAGDAGTKALVSSDPSLKFQDDAVQVDELLSGIIVPTNTDAVNSPNWTGNRLFVFWSEDRNLPGSGQTIMTRSYEQNETTASNPAIVLADRFDPPLTTSATTGNTEPVQIDNLPPGDLFEVNVEDDITVLADGETVGVYFDEDYHVYYTDTTGTAEGFDYENGAPAPQLVDNDTALFTTVVDSYRVDFPPREDCNWLRKSQVFFTRNDTAAGTGTTRAFIRVHN